MPLRVAVSPINSIRAKPAALLDLSCGGKCWPTLQPGSCRARKLRNLLLWSRHVGNLYALESLPSLELCLSACLRKPTDTYLSLKT